MSDKLKAAKKKSSDMMRTSSVTMTDRTKEQKSLPAGAKILSQTIRTETEEIENGWLISKNYDIKYQAKGDSSHDYMYYTKKYYSPTDPLTVQVTDKSLADEFSDE